MSKGSEKTQDETAPRPLSDAQRESVMEHVRTYGPTLQRHLQRYCRSADLVADLFQAMYAAWAGRIAKENRQPEDVLPAEIELRIAARRSWLNHLTSSKRRAFREAHGQAHALPLMFDRRLEDREALLLALETLPDGLFQVYALRQIEGHSEKDVAVLLGINKGTVKSRQNRAFRLLEKALQKEGC